MPLTDPMPLIKVADLIDIEIRDETARNQTTFTCVAHLPRPGDIVRSEDGKTSIVDRVVIPTIRPKRDGPSEIEVPRPIVIVLAMKR